jgi:hypothetical protein
MSFYLANESALSEFDVEKFSRYPYLLGVTIPGSTQQCMRIEVLKRLEYTLNHNVSLWNLYLRHKLLLS